MASIESIDIGTVPRRARRALGLRARAQRNDFSSLRGLSGTRAREQRNDFSSLRGLSGTRAREQRNDFISLRGLSGTDSRSTQLAKALQRTINNVLPVGDIRVDGIIGENTVKALIKALTLRGGTRIVSGGFTLIAMAAQLSAVSTSSAVSDVKNNPSKYITALGGTVPDPPSTSDSDGNGGDGGDGKKSSLPLVIGVSVAATVGIVALLALAR